MGGATPLVNAAKSPRVIRLCEIHEIRRAQIFMFQMEATQAVCLSGSIAALQRKAAVVVLQKRAISRRLSLADLAPVSHLDTVLCYAVL